MIDDIILLIASVMLSVSIVPQLIKNFKTKDISSHCIYWHITNITGYFLLSFVYFRHGFYISICGIFLSGCFRLIMIYQIRTYKEIKTPVKPVKRCYMFFPVW